MIVLATRCKRCNKFILFPKNQIEDKIYCYNCFNLINDELIELKKKELKQKELKKNQIEKKRKEKSDYKVRIKILRDKEEYEKIKDEIKSQEEMQKKKYIKSQTKKNKTNNNNNNNNNNNSIFSALTSSNISSSSSKIKSYIPKEILINNSRVLYVEADIKRILVIDWVDGKKRIALNKSRELRRTHAGGFSAEKFQKFIDFKKQKAFDWISEQLSRPGIIRKPYDIIKVSANDDLKAEIERFINEF